MLVVPAPSAATEVLLIHAPYPGRLRFDGVPSSSLYAVAPLARTMASQGRLDALGVLDPGNSSEAFYEELGALIEHPPICVVAISTSTAAIEETARIVAAVRGARGDQVLIIVGGPHEDDCREKVALRIPGVDLSIAGDAGDVLEFVVERFLRNGGSPPRHLVERLPSDLRGARALAGRFSVSSSQWGSGGETVAFDFGPLPVEHLAHRPRVERRARFSVFQAPETIPVLVSRGCSYGRCTFCAEGSALADRQVLEEFAHLRDALVERPNVALYFQDSIFPTTRAVREKLLPMLRELRVEWGAQVYLRTLTRAWTDDLARSGCRYLYTGLESGSTRVLDAIGKRGFGPNPALERLEWIRDAGIRVGVSLMFGAMTPDGELVETENSVDETVALAEQVCRAGVGVTGFYPNIQTVLPGTHLARGLESSGVALDFYRMPRVDLFEELEDGPVGYNFLTLPSTAHEHERHALARRIVEASKHVAMLSSSSVPADAGT